MRCLRCGYDLAGLTEFRCPECNRPFDPDDPDTFASRPCNGARPLILSLIALALTIIAGAIAVPLLGLPALAFAILAIIEAAVALTDRRAWIVHKLSLVVGLALGIVLTIVLGAVLVLFINLLLSDL
jgi:hypothetical protein